MYQMLSMTLDPESNLDTHLSSQIVKDHILVLLTTTDGKEDQNQKDDLSIRLEFQLATGDHCLLHTIELV